MRVQYDARSLCQFANILQRNHDKVPVSREILQRNQKYKEKEIQRQNQNSSLQVWSSMRKPWQGIGLIRILSWFPQPHQIRSEKQIKNGLICTRERVLDLILNLNEFWSYELQKKCWSVPIWRRIIQRQRQRQAAKKYFKVLERAQLVQDNAPVNFLNRDCKPCRLVAWLHMVSLASTKGKMQKKQGKKN